VLLPSSVRIAALSLLTCASVAASPWQAAGDESLRHDIQFLSDSGLLTIPVTTWPASWPDIARQVGSMETASLESGLAAALRRVQRRARDASMRGSGGIEYRISGASDVSPLRRFDATPREEGEVTAGASWLGDHVAVNLVAAVVTDPIDGRRVRADGSFAGLNIGNVMISAGLVDRWWGPGWEGSLILSNNARPIPALTIERNYSDPFETRLLSWLGPWRLGVMFGQLEGSDVAVADARFFGARATFKPRSWLEIGLSRTAQWCGSGRPCGFGTFKDLLLGQDNRSDSLGVNDEPGNQMAGYDARLRSPWHKLPLALYTQWIGEDEANGLPSKFLGLFGAEWWGAAGDSTYRLHVEYSDTTCIFTRQQPQFGCAYRNSLYPQGYTFRGRVIGHSLDNDSRMWSAGGILNLGRGDSLSAVLRRVDLNRDGGEHTIRDSPGTMNDVEFRYSRAFDAGKASVSVGWSDGNADSGEPDGLRGFLMWQKGF
jgi:hypothetical protein